MKSTLYLKFIIIYFIFGFLSIFTVGALATGLFSSPLNHAIASNLYKEANLVATDYLPKYFSEQVSLYNVHTQIDGMKTHLDAAVWFVDREGSLITSSQSEEYPLAPYQIADFNPAEIGSSQYNIGDYHGYFTEDVITVIAPVIYEYSPKGYLLIHKDLSDTEYMEDLFLRTIYITVTVIYILSFMILLAFRFFVYLPLSKITEAATQYASGNLDYEIPVTTQDEMGYLSASLNYMSSQLRDMEDYQKKFVANVSHDFRSPLTSIKGYVEAMADGTIPPELHEKYLKIILFETERLTDLTQDLLTLNEFDTKNLLLNRERFDIHEMIKNVAACITISTCLSS